MAIEIAIRVEDKAIVNALTCAHEGGINYWCDGAQVHRLPERCTLGDFRKGGVHHKGGVAGPLELVPLNGGTTKYRDSNTGKWHFLTAAKLKAAIQEMAITPRWANHWKDLTSEDSDVETGDLLVQLAVFGDIIYG